MDAKEIQEFFKGLSTTLADAISGSNSDGDDNEAKKAAAEKKAADEKEVAEKAEKEKAEKEKAEKDKGGDGGDGNDDPPELTKRIDDIEAAVKALTEDSVVTREALEKTLETVEKLAGASAVRKGLIEQDPDEVSSEEDLKKAGAKDLVGLQNAVAAAAHGATVRLE